MKKILMLALILFTAFNNLLAQPSFTVSDKEEVKLVKESILAVVVKDKDEKMLKKLSKDPKKLEGYEKSINEFNQFLKEAIQKEWSFSKEVKFISEAEAEKLKEEKNNGHCLLEITEVRNYKMNDFYSANKNTGFNTAQDRAYHFSSSGGSVALAIVHAARPKDEIVISYLPAVGVSQGSVTFMVCNLKNQLTDCLEKNITKLSLLKDDIEKRRPELKSKTLLIFDPLISNGLQKTIDKREVKKFYDYKYEIVPFEKADAIIANKDKNYAYIWVVPAGAVSNGKVLFNYFIIDAADARPLYLTGKAVVGANGNFHQAHLMMTNKKLE